MNIDTNMKQTIKQWASRIRVAILAGTLVAGGTGLALNSLVHAKEPAKTVPIRLEVDETPTSRDGKLSTSFAPVVKKVAPSVVKVFVTSTPKGMPQGLSPFDDPRFRRFFGDPSDGEEQEGRSRRVPKQHGLGSGVLVTADGYILTNNHVVENADEVKVALGDKAEEYTAKVVGADPKTDIAVLKIEGKNLPHITVADSDKIEVGDIVLAVGNPFGIGQTVTMGMVSATGRANMGIDYEDFIQTDAAINPGNSGGALVDAGGRLVGINTAILSRTGGNQGIGFAVPINLAKGVMESLIENGRVVRGFLGVNIQDVTPGLAKEFDLSETGGALVAEVTPKSPAEKAGIKSGDVIVEFNKKAVKDSRSLRLQVSQMAPDTQTSLTVMRDGRKKNLEVTVKELPGAEVASKSKGGKSSQHDALDGVTVGDLDGANRRGLRLPQDLKGAMVTNVEEDSAAFKAGLRPGDVILEINRKPVADAETAVALSEKIKDKSILLRVWSKGSSRYLVVDEDKLG